MGISAFNAQGKSGLLLCSWCTKHGFYILKWLEKIKIRIVFHDRDFPRGPVVRTLSSDARGASSIPGQEAKIPPPLWPKTT